MFIKDHGQAKMGTVRSQAGATRGTASDARLGEGAFSGGGREPQGSEEDGDAGRNGAEERVSPEAEEGPALGGMVGTSVNLTKTMGSEWRLSGPRN